MSIRIYNDGLAGAAASETSRAQDLSKASQSSKTSSGSAAGGEDQVQISSLSEALSAQGSQRTDRVQSLAAVYQNGGYQVNSMDVSRAIVNNALQMSGAESDQ
jgi:anti-sigma28 factor (negative regulator of flagellin synthesis)